MESLYKSAPLHLLYINHIKGYFPCKIVTSQNALLEAQVNFFFYFKKVIFYSQIEYSVKSGEH